MTCGGVRLPGSLVANAALPIGYRRKAETARLTKAGVLATDPADLEAEQSGHLSARHKWDLAIG